MTELTPEQIRETAAKIANSLVPSPGDKALVDDLIAIADRIAVRHVPEPQKLEPTNDPTYLDAMNKQKPKGCPEPAWPGCPPHHEHREFQFTWRPLPATPAKPCQCGNCQQLVDIIGNLVAVLRERHQSEQR